MLPLHREREFPPTETLAMFLSQAMSQDRSCQRVLDIDEIKSVPHVPMSHPFVERLIGSIRRELLDHTVFWTASDLDNKLLEYQSYYNENRCHSGLGGITPVETTGSKVADINKYQWEKHCRGLFELPLAA